MIDMHAHTCILWFSVIVPLSLDVIMYENGVETNENKILPTTKEWH